MRFRTLLRDSPMLLLAPLFAAILVVPGLIRPALIIPYSLYTVAKLVGSLAFGAPIVAFGSAWQGWQWRRKHVLQQHWVRSQWRILLAPLIVVIAVPWMIFLVVLFGQVMPHGSDWLVVAGALLLLLAWALTGFGLGLLLPPVVALPLSLVASASWFILPEANSPLWLRHLNGAWSLCCATQEILSPAAMLAAALLNSALAIGGSFLIIAASCRARRPLTISLTLLLAFIPFTTMLLPATALVSGHDHRSGWQRPRNVICAGEKPRLCLWPESEAFRPAIHASLARSYAMLTQQGVDLPVTFDEAATHPTPEASTFRAEITEDGRDFTGAMVKGLASPYACPQPSASTGILAPNANVEPALNLEPLLWAALGESDLARRSVFTPKLPEFERLQANPAERTKKINDTLRRLQRCG